MKLLPAALIPAAAIASVEKDNNLKPSFRFGTPIGAYNGWRLSLYQPGSDYADLDKYNLGSRGWAGSLDLSVTWIVIGYSKNHNKLAYSIATKFPHTKDEEMNQKIELGRIAIQSLIDREETGVAAIDPISI